MSMRIDYANVHYCRLLLSAFAHNLSLPSAYEWWKKDPELPSAFRPVADIMYLHVNGSISDDIVTELSKAGIINEAVYLSHLHGNKDIPSGFMAKILGIWKDVGRSFGNYRTSTFVIKLADLYRVHDKLSERASKILTQIANEWERVAPEWSDYEGA
jgi:hypothetical protein